MGEEKVGGQAGGQAGREGGREEPKGLCNRCHMTPSLAGLQLPGWSPTPTAAGTTGMERGRGTNTRKPDPLRKWHSTFLKVK